VKFGELVVVLGVASGRLLDYPHRLRELQEALAKYPVHRMEVEADCQAIASTGTQRMVSEPLQCNQLSSSRPVNASSPI
jgi:hypothetical protein